MIPISASIIRVKIVCRPTRLNDSFCIDNFRVFLGNYDSVFSMSVYK